VGVREWVSRVLLVCVCSLRTQQCAKFLMPFDSGCRCLGLALVAGSGGGAWGCLFCFGIRAWSCLVGAGCDAWIGSCLLPLLGVGGGSPLWIVGPALGSGAAFVFKVGRDATTRER
jgi:hypothetical protein